jgi:hypothetical protein
VTMTGTVDAANARIDLFVDYTAEPGTQTVVTVTRRVGHVNADDEYVRGAFGTTMLGEQIYLSDHEAPLDAQIWYVANADGGADFVAGPFTIASNGRVWLKDPGRPWADLQLDLCENPSRGEADCPVTPLISDTFTRTVVSGWGSTDTGQAWTNSGTAAEYSVTAGQGRHLNPAVSVSHRSTITQPSADVDVKVDMGVDQVIFSDDVYLSIMTRFVDSNNFYHARLEFEPAGQLVRLVLIYRHGGTEDVLDSELIGTFTPGQMFTLRFQTQGQNLRARAWVVGTAEPEVWQVVGTNAAFALPGTVGVRSIRQGANGNPSVISFFDNFSVSLFAASTIDIAWVGFQNKTRAADAGLFPVLDDERPSDVFARRKDITTGLMFLSRSLGAITGIYELFTAGGPLLVQVPAEYGMNAPYGQRDRYYQPDDLVEGYLSIDQRKTYRLWTVPATSVDAPIGEPQGTDTANWCALADTYATMGAYASSGYTWAQAATGQASTTNLPGLYGSGPYGSGPYGG